MLFTDTILCITSLLAATGSGLIAGDYTAFFNGQYAGIQVLNNPGWNAVLQQFLIFLCTASAAAVHLFQHWRMSAQIHQQIKNIETDLQPEVEEATAARVEMNEIRDSLSASLEEADVAQTPAKLNQTMEMLGGDPQIDSNTSEAKLKKINDVLDEVGIEQVEDETTDDADNNAPDSTTDETTVQRKGGKLKKLKNFFRPIKKRVKKLFRKLQNKLLEVVGVAPILQELEAAIADDAKTAPESTAALLDATENLFPSMIEKSAQLEPFAKKAT